jgi:hypothetical protein
MIEELIAKVHLVFLYVLMYSLFRNLNWFVDELTNIQVTVLKSLTIGFFFWFIGANLFLYLKKNKNKLNQKYFLSGYVLLPALAIIILLEYLVY